MVVGCDVLMLVFGIAAALINREHRVLKYIWFIASCVFYTIMLVTLHTDVANGSALEESESVQQLFMQLEVLTVVVWTCYPFAVVLGCAHLRIISRASEDTVLCILDMVSKIGMEGLIVVHYALM